MTRKCKKTYTNVHFLINQDTILKNRNKKRLSDVLKENMAKLAKESMYIHDDKSIQDFAVRTGLTYQIARSILLETDKSTRFDTIEQRINAMGGKIKLTVVGPTNKEIKDGDDE